MYDRSRGVFTSYRRAMERAEQAIEGVDLEVLRLWMDSRGLGDGRLSEVALITGGTQNILLSFERSGRRYVLRRPDRKSTRLNSSHIPLSRMPSSA